MQRASSSSQHSKTSKGYQGAAAALHSSVTQRPSKRACYSTIHICILFICVCILSTRDEFVDCVQCLVRIEYCITYLMLLRQPCIERVTGEYANQDSTSENEKIVL